MQKPNLPFTQGTIKPSRPSVNDLLSRMAKLKVEQDEHLQKMVLMKHRIKVLKTEIGILQGRIENLANDVSEIQPQIQAIKPRQPLIQDTENRRYILI